MATMPTMNANARLFGSARDVPPYFAGRRNELDTLRKRLEYIRRTGDPRGGLVLIDGVQGVGKTQLLEQFASTAAKDRRTAVLNVPTSGLANELALFASIVEVLGGNDNMAKQIADAAGGLTSAKIASVGVSAQRPDRLNLSLNDMLARSRRDSELWRDGLLILAVDEIQAIAAEERRTLKMLHDGLHGCPILLLGAGLQHATTRLAADLPTPDGRMDTSGISRFAERLTLGPLNHGDALQAIVLGLDAMGHRVGEEQAAVLAKASMGFPQHIHSYLRGALQAAAEHGDLGTDAALQSALAFGDQQRVHYYQERLRSMERPARMLALAQHMVESGKRIVFWDEAAAAISTSDTATEADDVLADAVSKGVLTTDEYHRVSFGIPSFHDHMAAEVSRLEQRSGRSCRKRDKSN